MKNEKRITFLALFLFFLFSVLIFHFFLIQIVEGDKWTAIAKNQHFFTIREPFLRGTFWSNSALRPHHPAPPRRFAVELLKYHLYIDPFSIPHKYREEIASVIEETIKLSALEQSELRAQFLKKTRSRRLARWLDVEKKDALLAWWSAYAAKHRLPRNAIYFVPEYRRAYPCGSLLGQVLHTVQEQRDENTLQGAPTGGLELYYDAYLRGKQGKRLLKRSPRHSFDLGQVLVQPEDGADIYLTIDPCIQAIVEEELEIGVKNSFAKGGWAVMMEPRSGEIIALAQYPFFSPSEYKSYFNDPELLDHTRVKAVTDAYEPGSVMKPFTVLMGLIANRQLQEAGAPPLFDPEQKYPCSDSRFPGRKKPLTDVRFHKFLNMNMAIQKSSNIYVARLAQKMIDQFGPHWYRQVLESVFGFGRRTGIDLPSESPGALPRPGKLHPNGALEWSVPTPFSLAMGHNLQVNSVQLAAAYSLLANGGYRVRPTLVKKIVKTNKDGTEVILLDNTSRPETFPRVIDSSLIARVVESLQYVTQELGGSAQLGNIPGYSEAGKTGTSHKIVDGVYSPTKFISGFAGFAPVKHPAFVLIIAIDEPEKKFIPGLGNNHRGSICAAPVFRAIGTRTLEYLGIEEDDPFGYPRGDRRRNAERSHWSMETKNLQKLYEQWNQ